MRTPPGATSWNPGRPRRPGGRPALTSPRPGWIASSRLHHARLLGRLDGLDPGFCEKIDQQRREAEAAGSDAGPGERVVVLAEAVPVGGHLQRLHDPVGVIPVSE